MPYIGKTTDGFGVRNRFVYLASNGGTAINGTETNLVSSDGSLTVAHANCQTIIDLTVGNKIWLQAYANWWGGSWMAGAGYFSVMQVG